MEFKHEKQIAGAAASLVGDILRVRGPDGKVVALSGRKVWESDLASFEESLTEPGAVQFYPGDSITITF